MCGRACVRACVLVDCNEHIVKGLDCKIFFASHLCRNNNVYGNV